MIISAIFIRSRFKQRKHVMTRYCFVEKLRHGDQMRMFDNRKVRNSNTVSSTLVQIMIDLH